ncbi:UvrD-helicase domain-containing protein [Aquipuribacter sp. MA13-6]|uniref:UvrD-helicase domain-containing protein n=1 Tax=unclassified Aquipuribacter TaxID=2635084 RepID=UPI003EED5A0D
MSGDQPEPEPLPFDLDGPLPIGTSVLEASAGTGKTYTIARLVSRYVSEGLDPGDGGPPRPVPMDQLLVISFSRDATRELRERVRDRLVTDRDAAAPGPVRERLDRALADFDGATVTTTHAFCHAMLTELGTAADHDRDAVLVEDPSDLVGEVADDLYVRKWGHPGAAPADLTPEQFRELARVAAADPTTPLVPRLEDTDDPAARLRARVALAVRQEVDRRKRRGRLLDYDDMVTRLDAALQDPDTAVVAATRMRARFRVVLVDEFQDTDPAQWRILRTAFHHHATLVLVGDPKQAVYGFRGADVHAYLQARHDAAGRASLPFNHRSDPGVLTGLSALLGGAALGDERIRVRPVTPAHRGRMVDVGAPVELRVVPREGHALNRSDLVSAADARATVREDCARQVVALLDGDVVVRPRGDAATAGGPRPLHPGDIAVIVRLNSEAVAIQARLRAAGVPAVVSGRTSVFDTPAASEWQRLLEALEQPHRTSRVRTLGLGRLVGLDAAHLAGDDDALDRLGLQLREWVRVLGDRGVAALFEAVSAGLLLQERLLAQPDGERLLTDLRHVAEVLHEAALAEDLGLTALSSWLHRRRTSTGDGVERSRRLETDADAVQVLTSHMSKGLQFPVVLAPSLWSHWSPKPPYPRFHDEHGVRTRDVGGPGGRDFAAHVSAHQREDADEELRLAYVTLTRAQSKVITWWAPTANTGTSPLHRLLAHDDPSTVAPFTLPVPSDADALARFHARASAGDGAMTVQTVPVGDTVAPVPVWSGPRPGAPRLELARFDRGLDLGWRRTSYSALTAAAHDAAYAPGGSGPGAVGAGAAGGTGPGGTGPGVVGREADVTQKDDESDVDDTVTGGPAPGDPDAHLHDVVSPWQDLPGGTGFGTLVHGVLERYDPAVHGPGGSGSLADLVGALTRGQGADVAALTGAVATAVATPLGPLADGLAFGDVARADLLPELDFELPLAGGDTPAAAPALLGDLVGLWREHVPAGPTSGYPDVLAQLGEASLRGYLSGSVDAIVRVGPPGSERYLVVDHKTNRLAPRDQPLTAWHYRAAALEESMTEAHYPLQALLYAVALHRYLRWRRPGYEPGTHLGGVLYLYLRGMSGPGVLGHDGHVPGVFAWRPPADLVMAFSDLLAGGR